VEEGIPFQEKKKKNDTYREEKKSSTFREERKALEPLKLGSCQVLAAEKKKSCLNHGGRGNVRSRGKVASEREARNGALERRGESSGDAEVC